MNLDEAVEILKPILAKAVESDRRTKFQVNFFPSDVAALAQVLAASETQLQREMMTDTEADLELQNAGSLATARTLLDVAKSGEHHGRYGCPVMNEVADRIVSLYRERNDLGSQRGALCQQSANAALELAAQMAENWGGAPANPNGRRAALAAAIRSQKANAVPKKEAVKTEYRDKYAGQPPWAARTRRPA